MNIRNNTNRERHAGSCTARMGLGEKGTPRAAALRLSVEQALMSAVPGLRASIQLLPSDVEAHASDEKDLL